jgi:DNA-binding MarR family transcriptional regulator
MLLCELWQTDGLTQSELAERLAVQPATVSKMLSRMDSAGLVSGCRDAADGRITRQHLTEAGQAWHQPIQEAWERVDSQIVANFSVEERVLLRRLLMQVLDNLTPAA